MHSRSCGALKLAQVAAAVGAGASPGRRGPQSLDPALYVEPLDADYWGGAGTGPIGTNRLLPLQERRFRSASLSRESFDRLIQDGQVFVVEGLGQDWPMSTWDCEYFRTDPTFRQAELSQQYAANAGSGSGFVGFSSDWLGARSSSGAPKDGEAPQLAPFYWGIKDVQHEDAHQSRTWTREMLRKVREAIQLPAFMDPRNLRNFEETPEFWFAAGGAGAKAHMDSHVQATMSLQLAGRKRWRLGMMSARHAPYLAMIYQDGDIYRHEGSRGRWAPLFNITLQQGDALFFPPGFIHETFNLDSTAGSCSASVTFQFDQPMATRLYRRFLPRVRRTADIHEAWPLLATWAGLRGRVPKAGLPYEEARAQALGRKGAGSTFRKLDKNDDGALVLEELLTAKVRAREAAELLSFHDLDEDGSITREEFAEVFGHWAGTVHKVMADTPEEYREFQLRDMEGDFNIEDLPQKLRPKLLKAARELEEAVGRRGAGPGAGSKPPASTEL